MCSKTSRFSFYFLFAAKNSNSNVFLAYPPTNAFTFASATPFGATTSSSSSFGGTTTTSSFGSSRPPAPGAAYASPSFAFSSPQNVYSQFFGGSSFGRAAESAPSRYTAQASYAAYAPSATPAAPVVPALPAAPAAPLTPEGKLKALLVLQAFNGSWSLDNAFAMVSNLIFLFVFLTQN